MRNKQIIEWEAVESFGYIVTIYRSDVDGAVVIQIDTPTDVEAMNEDGSPRCRVDLNEAHLYEGVPIN